MRIACALILLIAIACDSAPPSATVNKVCTITSELLEIPRSRLKASTSLADIGCDELDFAELTMELEDQFDLAVTIDANTELHQTLDLALEDVTMQKLADAIDAELRRTQTTPKPNE